MWSMVFGRVASVEVFRRWTKSSVLCTCRALPRGLPAAPAVRPHRAGECGVWSLGAWPASKFSEGGRNPPCSALAEPCLEAFQRPLLLDRTVRANVEYGLWARGQRRSFQKVDEILRALHLQSLASRPS